MGEFLLKIRCKFERFLNASATYHRPSLMVGLFVILSVSGVLFAYPAFAKEDSTAGKIFGSIGAVLFMMLARVFQSLAALFGMGLLYMVGVLVDIAQYNSFIDSPAIAKGWLLVRDITNMFYILVMLLIAFGTMLGMDQYSYKNKTVTKLLLAAVIVNFSRTFCGLMIDFGQVVMLTFVYGFQAAAGGNFLEAIGLANWMRDNSNADVASFSGGGKIAFNAMLGMALVAILALIALVVVIYMTVMLTIRIVYLWLLVVMSPAAFFLRAVPLKSAEKYYGEWWGMFTGQVIFGPVMAFFLWLTLAVAGSDGGVTDGFTGSTNLSSGTIEGWSVEQLKKFVIAICLLVGGTNMASKISGSTAGMAKTIMKKSPGMMVKATKFTGRQLGKIKAGRRDAVTGESPTIATRFGAAGAWIQQKAEKSGLSRTLGLNTKERKDEIAQHQQLAQYKASGEVKKAEELEKQLVAKGADTFGKKYSQDQLKSIMNNQGSSLMDKQRAMLALANGYGDFRGMGTQLSSIIPMGASPAFENQLREALKAKGDDTAMLKTLDDVKKLTSKATTPRQLAQYFDGMLPDAMPDASGNMKRRDFSQELLTGVDASVMNATDDKGRRIMNDKSYKNILDEIMVASMYEKNGQTKTDLEKLYKGITGHDMSLAAGLVPAGSVYTGSSPKDEFNRLNSVAENQRAAATAGKHTLGDYERPPLDVAALELLADSDNGDKILELMKNAQSFAAAGDSARLATAMTELTAEMAKAKTAVAGQSSTITDAMGALISNDAAIDQSGVGQDVARASGTTDMAVASNLLKSSAIALEDSIRRQKMPPEERRVFDKEMKQGKIGIDAAQREANIVLSRGSDSVKLNSSQKFSNMGISVIERLEKQGANLSEEVRTNLKALKSDLKEIGASSVYSPAIAAKIQNAAQQLSVVKKQI
jgi:hypothetical protein